MRRKLWYDLIFYKQDLLRHTNDGENLCQTINPIVLRLLQFPIPDEIRCIYWAIALDIRSYYNSGYFSNLQNKSDSIPEKTKKLIKDDLGRPEGGYSIKFDGVEKVLVGLIVMLSHFHRYD